MIDIGVPKQHTNPGSRGLRELKGLIFNVNYDGVSSRSRSKVSSTAVGLLVVVNDSTTTFLKR